MIVDSHQHVMLPTSMQIKKMDDAGVDKVILFATTPHVERAESAALEAIRAEMQVLYQLLSGGYSPEKRISKRFWPSSAGAFQSGNSRMGSGTYRRERFQGYW